MAKSKLIKGDKVLVIAGKDRHKTGVVEQVLPARQLVVVTGLNMVKKHIKRSAKTPQGGIIDMAKPLHISNVMLLDPTNNKPTRLGYQQKGKDKVRVSKLTKEVLKAGK